MMIQKLLLSTILLVSVSINAQITFAPLFQDNMVLQRNTEVAIWGNAIPGETLKVTVSWNPMDTILVPVDHFGKWKAKLKTGEAGGPYQINILMTNRFWGESRANLNNILLGEVWLCSGQSNMEWTYTHGLGNPEKEIPAANYPDIRIFTVPKVASVNKQEYCGGQWKICTPSVMKQSSALAYFYARQLHKKLNVPIGVIVSAWEGTNVEVWMNDSIVQSDPVLLEISKKYTSYSGWPIEPGTCYNTMIYPLMPFTLAGIIWYQGEANAGKDFFPVYDQLMRSLIQSWRFGFGKNLPFYFVQIAPFKYGTEYANYLREQQAKTALFDNTAMVVVSDLINNDTLTIHPINKWAVGDRLANLALAKSYQNKNYPYLYPRFKKMEIKGNKAYLTFSDCICPLQIKGQKIKDLQVCDDDRIFVDGEAEVKNDTLVVWSKKVKHIKAVRYAFKNTAIGNLYSGEGLPVIPFRTDQFEELDR